MTTILRRMIDHSVSIGGRETSHQILSWPSTPTPVDDELGPYSRTSYDISKASDWSRWPSRPIRSLRYIVACTRIWTLCCTAIRLSIALAIVQRTPQKRDRDARCGDEDYPKTLDFLFIHWPPIRRIR